MGEDKKIFLLLVGTVLLLAGGILVKKTVFQKESSPSQIPTVAPTPTVTPQPKITGKPTPAKQSKQKAQALGMAVGPCKKIPILMYHHVADKNGSLYVRPDIFVKQMDYLVQKGYVTVTLPEIVAHLAVGQNLPPKTVAMTFDDGYLDNYSNAYPVLTQRNLKATIFIITQLLGGSEYLTWEQVREMAGNSLITIGDHTLSHRALPKLSKEEMRNEILSAKNILEANLGIKVSVFAYPYGNTDKEIEKVLQEGGFTAAVINRSGSVCARLPYEIPRIRVGNASLSAYGL